MRKLISIIICTHNRSVLLKYCLDSLANQSVNQDLFEVIVVDNKSVDDTAATVESYKGIIKNIKYIFEERIGLSYARNRGVERACSEWVLYLDDDAKAHRNMVEQALDTCRQFDFACFGGRFFPWYITPKPDWLSGTFGEFPLLRLDVGEISEHQYVPGGILVCKKSILQGVGGFPVELGMSGKKVGYGEENWIQMEMRKRGFKIGFDPELKIDHLVASYKYSLVWHLKRHYAKGKTAALMERRSVLKAWLRMIKSLLVTGKVLITNFPKFLIKDYYYQNYLLDSLGYFTRSLGYLLK